MIMPLPDAVYRLTVINPNTSEALTAQITAAARAVALPQVSVRGTHPSRGVSSVESHAEETWAALGVVEQVQLHDADTDAFVVACFGDTGVDAAREVATGPVVGMTEAALTTAALLAHRFAVITLPPRTMAHTDRVLAATGLRHRCSVHAVEVSVEDLEGGSTHLLPAFIEAASRAIEQDHAEAIVLGCAGLADLVPRLRAATGLPVVEGVAAAVGIATSLLAQGLSSSRHSTYARVPDLPTVAEVW